MSAGTRRNGTSKFGLFKHDGQHEGQHEGQHGGQHAGQHGPQTEAGGHTEHYAGRHAGPRRTTARKRFGKVVPAAAVAATLAAGAAAYGLAGGGGPQAAQLADAAQPAGLSSAAHAGLTAGGAESAASALIRAARTAGGSVAHPSARAQASTSRKAAPAKSSGTSSAATSSAGTPSATASSASPSATASASSTHAAATLSCDLNYSLLPANVTAIVSFLLAHGYSDNAAAGIAGNMYQESKGNPESEGMGGGGLIGFTPLPDGYVTGNPAVDLQTQLAAVLSYNQGWSGYLPELEDAATPADAAYIYVTDFERAGIPAAATREASAQAVAQACGI